MGAEVPGDSVGDEFKGYVFKITGGNDKQGFPMKQGVMHPTRVRLLLADGHSCYRPRRTGERKRKSVRGCIVAMDLSVLALAIVKKGDGEIPGLTDRVEPKRLGPKRATKIRRFFGLTKEDDVCLPMACWDGQDRARFKMLIELEYRFANSSFAAKSNLKVKAKNHTPKPPKSNVSLLLSVSSISVVVLLLSVARVSVSRMLP